MVQRPASQPHPPGQDDPSVRLWDPAKKWTTGDQVIVAVSSLQGNRTTYAPFVGEIVNVEANIVNVRIDALRKTISYRTRAEYGKDDLQKWRRLVEKLVEARRGARDMEAQVEFVILQHGERVISQLLDTLKADDRFVRLAGRWFLRQLAMSPTEEQLNVLAWAMVPLEEPRPTAKLVPLVAPPLTDGDPGLFGLYLAMRHHPDLFENVDPGQRPRWVLAGPPPGSFTPRHAAYDAETYEVLCLSHQVASSKVVRRLWNLNLLQAVA